MDWIGLAKIGEFESERKIGPRLAPDWHGLARIGKDWQIGEFESERKIDPGLAQDWHGLARIDMDWHGLGDWQICVGTKN